MRKIYRIRPVEQRTMWGSDKIIKLYDIKTDLDNIGQLYHVIALPGHLDCLVEDVGEPLSAFYEKNPELFDCPHKEFPIRMATVCSVDNMSYQLHPSDEYALKHEGCRGKVAGIVTIEETDDITDTIFGNTAKTLDEFKAMVEAKDWDKLFDRVQWKDGDFLNTPTGVIHGVKGDGKIKISFGTGGDITYRFYDFERNDPKRPLQLEQVYECVNIPEVPIGPIHVEPVRKGGMLQYDYYSAPNEYTAKRFRVETSGVFELDKFMFFVCVKGRGTVGGVELVPGQTVFVPAHYGPVELCGEMELFMISCPD